MLRSYEGSGNFIFYYDYENKCFARFPSKSNVMINGSDNSLFFGMNTNDIVSNIFCKMFNKKNINDINGLKFEMHYEESAIEVLLNINSDGQIQIKICKNGTMGKIANDYMFNNMKEIDITKMLIVVDFNNCEIRFKDPELLKL